MSLGDFGSNFMDSAMRGYGFVKDIERDKKRDAREEDRHRLEMAAADREEKKRGVAGATLGNIGKKTVSMDSIQQVHGDAKGTMSPEQLAVIQQAALNDNNPALVLQALSGAHNGQNVQAMGLKPQEYTASQAWGDYSNKVAEYDAESSALAREKATTLGVTEKLNSANQLWSAYESGVIGREEFAEKLAGFYNKDVQDGFIATVFGDQVMFTDINTGRVAGEPIDLNNKEQMHMARLQLLSAIDPSYVDKYGTSLKNAMDGKRDDRQLKMMEGYYANQAKHQSGVLANSKRQTDAYVESFRQVDPARIIQVPGPDGQVTYGVPMMGKGGQVTIAPLPPGTKLPPKLDPAKQAMLKSFYDNHYNPNWTDAQLIEQATRFGLSPDDLGVGGLVPNADSVASAVAIAKGNKQPAPASAAGPKRGVSSAFANTDVPPGYYVNPNGGVTRGAAPAPAPLGVDPAGLARRVNGMPPALTIEDLQFFQR